MASVRALCIGWLAVASGMGACRREDSSDQASPSLQRGDSVVIEGKAAEFFQGRVLEVGGETLRVQTDSGDPLTVARGDVYRLPATAVAMGPGELAICRTGTGKWVGCKVAQSAAARVVATDAHGHSLDVSGAHILRPTPLTKLNLERLFERARDREVFMNASDRAGQPKAPQGWSPETGERVVAKHELGWFYARTDLGADGGTSLRSESDRGGALSNGSTPVPLPPYNHAFNAGEFALLEPKSAAERWKPVRVQKIVPDGVMVIDEDGAETEVLPRKLIPLSPR